MRQKPQNSILLIRSLPLTRPFHAIVNITKWTTDLYKIRYNKKRDTFSTETAEAIPLPVIDVFYASDRAILFRIYNSGPAIDAKDAKEKKR